MTFKKKETHIRPVARAIEQAQSDTNIHNK